MSGIYFSVDNDSEGFRLPVNTEVVDVEAEADGETFKISGLGAVNVPKDIDLKGFNLKGFFPGQEYHFLETDFLEPNHYIEKLNKWMKDKEPVRYIYVDGSFSINEMVTIDTFNYKESFGSTDVDFEITLLEYVDFEPKKLKVAKPKLSSTKKKKPAVKKKAKKRQNKKPKPKTYSLKSGDSLWKVAQKYTGKGSNYPALAKLNKIKKADYRRLPIGLKLKIPPSWSKK